MCFGRLAIGMVLRSEDAGKKTKGSVFVGWGKEKRVGWYLAKSQTSKSLGSAKPRKMRSRVSEKAKTDGW